MEISTLNGQLCVELDTGSMFSQYQDYITNFNQTLIDILNQNNDLATVLHTDVGRGASALTSQNSFKKGDGLLIIENNQIQNFP